MTHTAEIQNAEINDLPSILELQKLAFQSEAALVEDYFIPPLTQTLDGIKEDFASGVILKAFARGNPNEIIGSVRGRFSENTLYIGKLIVNPSFQNRGIGTALLLHIESLYPKARYELFTSDRSDKSLSLYIRNGYAKFKQEPLNDNANIIFLQKSKGV
jgi:ribosomal protein S18 acetylase RimI-like enzyme